MIIQLLGFIMIFIGGFLAGKEYGATATISKMGDEIIKATVTFKN